MVLELARALVVCLLCAALHFSSACQVGKVPNLRSQRRELQPAAMEEVASDDDDINAIIARSVDAANKSAEKRCAALADAAAEKAVAMWKPALDAQASQIAGLQSATDALKICSSKQMEVTDDHESRIAALERVAGSAASSSGATGSLALARARQAEDNILRIFTDIPCHITEISTALDAALKLLPHGVAVANAVEVKGPPRGGVKFRIEFRRPESGYATGATAAAAFRDSLLVGGVWKKIEFKRADARQGLASVFPDRASWDALAGAVATATLERLLSIDAVQEGEVTKVGNNI